MLDRSEEEYSNIRKDIKEVQDCITSYIQFYFMGGVAIASLFGFAVRFGIFESYAWSARAAGFSAGAVISLTSVAFTSILFHKFITHNRYTGSPKLFHWKTRIGSMRDKLNLRNLHGNLA